MLKRRLSFKILFLWSSRLFTQQRKFDCFYCFECFDSSECGNSLISSEMKMFETFFKLCSNGSQSLEMQKTIIFLWIWFELGSFRSKLSSQLTLLHASFGLCLITIKINTWIVLWNTKLLGFKIWTRSNKCFELAILSWQH